jgi:hypothetical protein
MMVHADGRPEPDQILPSVRRVVAVIAPLLALAFGVLYLVPNNGPHFAMSVEPRMTAMLLGATYLTGVIYFSTVLRARAWHQIRLGLLPVSLFAGILGITTILHWSEFNHARVHFWLWATLYFTVPPLLPLLWLKNERLASPLPSVPGDVLLGATTRWVLTIIGLGLAGTALLLFLAPSLMIGIWPWELSELTSRITSAELALFSFFALHLAKEARWSQVRDLLRPQLASPLLFLGAVFISRADFDWSNPLAWAFLAFVVVVFLLGFPVLYLTGESARRANAGREGERAGKAVPAG